MYLSDKVDILRLHICANFGCNIIEHILSLPCCSFKNYCKLFTDYSSEEERDHSSSDESEIDGMSCDGMAEDDSPKKAATKEEKLVNTFIS